MNYGIDKVVVPQKLFGLYPFDWIDTLHPYAAAIKGPMTIPTSRHTQIDETQLAQAPLDALAYHPVLGPDIIVARERHDLYIFGHFEYEADTLQNEYTRDVGKGQTIDLPYNYFPENDTTRRPVNYWQQSGKQLFANWLSLIPVHENTL
ncbi:homoserine O-acetyltransferase/O-succinyltransferase family protein [Macrococcus equipercicus]|uniref:homoserine O-acetyltransferase/O-succinyltransferase family protein n=1 Tax=Macrococcus equipercicus TaxID=69967 RepID=UPI001478B3DA|nr:homoserine O-succinyltransferase [Macrococcus equipercicus]